MVERATRGRRVLVEVGGAVLLLIPATRMWGALLLACTMCGALMVHVFVIGISPPTIGVVLLLLSLVAIGVDAKRGAPSVSAYIATALAQQDREESLADLLRDLVEQHGEPTAEERQWARRVLRRRPRA